MVLAVTDGPSPGGYAGETLICRRRSFGRRFTPASSSASGASSQSVALSDTHTGGVVDSLDENEWRKRSTLRSGFVMFCPLFDYTANHTKNAIDPAR
jgi:hypothetical protein